MASKRRPGSSSPRRSASSRRPANWYLQLGRAAARDRARVRVQSGMLSPDAVPDYIAAAALRRRLSVRNYLADTVKELRRFFTGFEARDGYSISDLHTWPKARADSVRQYGEYLHQLQASPYVEVSPKLYRGKKRSEFRQALRRQTGQGLARQKKYLWHVDQTKRPTEVKFIEKHLEVREPIRPKDKKPSYVFRRYWFFRDYLGRQPMMFSEIIEAAKLMLPDMPDHLWYALFGEPHGVIDVPVQKAFIIQTLFRYSQEYLTHEGFSETLLGFIAQGTRESAMKKYTERLNRRMRAEMAKSERVKVRRRRLAFQRRAGRVR